MAETTQTLSKSTDDWIVRNIFGKSLYQACIYNIHPNTITSFALVMSIAIPFLHVHNFVFLVSIFIIIRQLCDLLDGPVARECKKTSTTGGILDTLADYIFIGSCTFIILHKFYGVCLISVWGAILVPVILLVITAMVYSGKVIYDHSLFKYDNSVHSMISNHSILISIVIVIIYLLFFNQKQKN